MDKNLKRLLGVILGKVVPLLCIEVLVWTPCESPERFFCHYAMIVGILTATEYMAFSSKQWAYVGGLMGGFSCVGLLAHPGCNEDTDTVRNTNRAGSYKEIIEVAVCLMIQIVVDGLLNWTTARDLTISKLEEACKHLKAGL